ncbi:MAG: hypothetical protein WD971_00835 [Pirellulales bacterium]
MFRRFHNLTAFSVVGTSLVLTAGCQMPPHAIGEAQTLEASHQSTASAARETPKKKALESVATAADDATVATVMQEVQQISAKDPAAGKLLLDELSRAEPKIWPLVVQQFRSQQAFHEQLLAKPKTPTESPGTKALDVASTEPPSEEVGQLTDPRGIRSDPRMEQAFAKATPANMPAPIDSAPPPATLVAQAAPATFADDASAAPLPSGEHVGPASAVNAGEVQQALFSADTISTQAAPKRDWQQHVKLAIEDLNEQLVDGPRSTAEVHQLVSLRLLDLLTGDTEAALKPIPNVSTEEQDYWSGQIFALATFLDHHRQPDDQRRAAASVVHLDEAVGHLRELGTLSLRNLAFCKNVYGYGAYEPINSPSFTPGQQVTLYLEIENYHSESTQKGYATKLGASYELVDEAGERVAGGDFPNIEDCCQSRRRDFHIQYGLVLPKTAKAGKHHLKLVMNDRQSDKMGSASIAFEIR